MAGVHNFVPTTFALFEDGRSYCLNYHLQTVVSRTNELELKN